MQIRVVISGRSYETAESVPEHLMLPDGSSVDDALQTLAELVSDAGGFSDNCLVAVSGAHLGTLSNHRPQTLQDGDELIVIAPVAGG